MRRVVRLENRAVSWDEGLLAPLTPELVTTQPDGGLMARKHSEQSITYYVNMESGDQIHREVLAWKASIIPCRPPAQNAGGRPRCWSNISHQFSWLWRLARTLRGTVEKTVAEVSSSFNTLICWRGRPRGLSEPVTCCLDR